MKRILFSIAIVGALLVGCSGGNKEEAKPADKPAEPAKPADKPAEPKPAADPVAEAKNIFSTRCTVCHGASGKGDGPTAATLNPKPRDYTDAEWQKTVTDADLTKIIVEGGPAAGKSPLMPANPDLKGKEAVVAEMVKMIRGFAAAGGAAAPAEGDKAAAPADAKK
jgi:mono/diheme cytochrome c family protein